MKLGGKLEINLFESDRALTQFSAFALQQHCPAIVINPMFIANAIVDRSTKIGPLGGYHLIAAVDFPAGGQHSIDKFKNCPRDFMSADGFEILLSRGNRAQIHNEMKALYDWVKMMNPTAEIRWVIPANATDDMVKFVAECSQEFKPDFIRLDHKVTVKDTTYGRLDVLRKYYKGKIKMSGNITFDVIAKYHKKVDRFDVTLEQAKKIAEVAKPLKDWPKDEPKSEASKETAIKHEVGDDGEYDNKPPLG